MNYKIKNFIAGSRIIIVGESLLFALGYIVEQFRITNILNLATIVFYGTIILLAISLFYSLKKRKYYFLFGIVFGLLLILIIYFFIESACGTVCF